MKEQVSGIAGSSAPGPRARQLVELSKQYEVQCTTPQMPLAWDHAQGARLWDVDGKEYIDFTSGVLVVNIGHSHPQYVAAAQKQAGRLMNCYDFLNEPRVLLAKRLVEMTLPNLQKAFISNSGSEAIEIAVKIAKRFTGRHEILAFQGAFHGRTYATMSLAGKQGTKRGFGPLMPGVVHAPFCYCYRCAFDKTFPTCDYWCVKHLDLVADTQSSGDLAAVIVEPYQGAGGSVVPPPGYMERLQGWCDRRGVLLIFDEVQSCFGRTGKMFAYEHYDIRPNLVVLGKGLGSGVTISGVLCETRLADALRPGDISSTYGGNPFCCAVALEAVDITQREGLPQRAEQMGHVLAERFAHMQGRSPYLGDVRGMGLVYGLELVADKQTKQPAPELARELVHKCFEAGLALIAPLGLYGNVIRIAPPLMIERELVDRALDILEWALSSVE
jgi:4-aminobutyrate aminotransferase / (S)-3-amino-2-methylpropionate transaminase / 5-aminovalerate transaminase